MMKGKCHKCALLWGPGSVDSYMIHIQCSWLGAESFINKYDSDRFMSTVKVMAFSILETYPTTSHMWTWELKSMVRSSSHSSLLTEILLFIFLTILDDNLFLIQSYFLLVLYYHVRLLVYCTQRVRMRVEANVVYSSRRSISPPNQFKHGLDHCFSGSLKTIRSVF